MIRICTLLLTAAVLLEASYGPQDAQEWIVSTRIPVSLELQGINLSSRSRIRIVAPAASCTGVGPAATTNLLLRCPACTQADPDLDIELHLLSYNTVGCSETGECKTVYIIAVRILDSALVEVEFDGLPGLQSGDRIVLGSGVECSAGCSEAQLAQLRGAGVAGHAVTATADEQRFLLPLGFNRSGGVLPAFNVSSGQWVRTSRAQTGKELMALEDEAGMKVCLANDGGGSFLQVGTLSFVEPAPLPVAQLNPTGTAVGTTAPVIVSFRTGSSRPEYAAREASRLTLAFLDLSLLEPRVVDGSEAETLSGDTESQTACGRYFRELWSDGDGGFPMPRACVLEKFGAERHLQISFDSSNGLRADRQYQIVFTATLKEGLDIESNALELRSRGPEPFLLIERGQARLSRQLQDGPSSGSPQIAELEVVGGSNGLLELSGDRLNLQLRLAGEVAGPITGSAILRLFLSPFTAWNYPTTEDSACSSRCFHGDGQNTSEEMSCQVSSLGQALHFNVIRMTLPADMAPIAGDVQMRLHVFGLQLPRGAFFPERWGAQVTAADDSKPHYVVVSGGLIYRLQRSMATVAQLLTYEGDLKPFCGDVQNKLYIRLALGATLRSAMAGLAPGGAASLSILAPEGYSLMRVESESKRSCAPSGDGALEPSRWSCAGRSCTYSLKPLGAIWAHSAVCMQLTVTNPDFPMQRGEPRNVWQLSMQASGFHSSSVMAPVAAFRSFSESSIGTGVAVLGRLSRSSLQPTRMAASSLKGGLVTHDLEVFFTTQQTVRPEALLILQAPAGFEFHEAACSDLPLAYYATDTFGEHTWPLPQVSSCGPPARARNVASIFLAGTLQGGLHYGFRIKVSNPHNYSASQQSSWALSTASAAGNVIDSTPAPLGFDSQGTDAFGVYQRELFAPADATQPDAGLLGLEIGAGLPFHVSGQEALVTIFPLRTGVDLEATMRVTAPSRYEWSFMDKEFVYHTADVPGATADLPGGVPSRRANVLAWPLARYAGKETYGFSGGVRLPSAAPVLGAMAFFVEFGYNDRSWNEGSRPLAGRVEAPPIRALRNAAVTYNSNVQGQRMTLQFEVETITPVPSGGGLLVRSPSGFSFVMPCSASAPVDFDLDHSRTLASRRQEFELPHALPASISCSSRPFPPLHGRGQSGSRRQVDLMLAAGEDGIPPGSYIFEVTAVIPTELASEEESAAAACDDGGSLCWTFFSLANLAQLESFRELDARVSAPPFAVKRQMPEASLWPIPGRTDRPLESNQLCISFMLGQELILGQGSASAAAVLQLRGPRGFAIQEECLVNHTVPEIESAPLAGCKGNGHSALLQIKPPGLKAQRFYAFVIQVSSNPPSTPARNTWVLEAHTETSEPFAGFAVQTFTEVALDPLSSAVGAVWPSGINLVNLTFQPQSSQSSQLGKPALVVKAPEGFVFDEGRDSRCPAMLQELHSSIFPPHTLDCLLQADNVLVIDFLSSSHLLVGGRKYLLALLVALPANITSEGQWKLESFQDRLHGDRLDVCEVPSFELCQPLWTWMVGEMSSSGKISTPSQDGGVSLQELLLVFGFHEDVIPGDSLELVAPAGYSLVDANSTSCANLRWLSHDASGAAWPVSVVPQCSEGRIALAAGNETKVVIPARTTMRLQVSTANPRRPSASWATNFWHVSHFRQQKRLATGAFRSWRVIPQLEQLSIDLASSAKGQRLSIMHVSFVAISGADMLRISVPEPAGFDFSMAYLEGPDQNLSHAAGHELAVELLVEAGQLTTVRLHDVTLPAEGGVCVVNLETNRKGVLADRRLGYSGGLRVPGHILLDQPELESEGQVSAHPIKSFWPPQLESRVVLSFSVKFADRVQEGQSFQLSGQPFQFQQEGLSLAETHGGAVVPTSVPLTVPNGAVVAKVLGEGVEPGVLHTLKAIAVAPALAGAVRWRLEVLDGHQPLSFGFVQQDELGLVKLYEVQVTARRSPPLALVELVVLMSLGTSKPTKLTLVAPLGFNFPEDCLAAPSYEARSCRPGQSLAGQATADLMTPGISGVANGLKLKVLAPASTPEQRGWLLIGKDSAGKTVGWGEDSAGIDVMQMRDVSLVFPAVPEASSQFVVRLRLSEAIHEGSQVWLGKPPEIFVNCSGPELQPISMPVADCKAEPSSVTLSLPTQLPPGEYAFAMTSAMPAVTPPANKFSLIVYGAGGRVLDAATSLEGRELQAGLWVGPRNLQWTADDAGQASSITLGFEVQKALGKGVLGTVLFTFPENFKHTLETADGIEVLNNALPILTDRSRDHWADIRMVDRIAVHLNAEKDIPPGVYDIRFPVSVPEELPAFNVWQVTLCRPGSLGSVGACLQPDAHNALATFPSAGFSLSNVTASVPVRTRAAADKVVGRSVLWIMSLAIFLGIA